MIITDGGNTYTVFTYNCDMMQWTGYWRHAVVGYNARGTTYRNHPAAGFDIVGTAVACPNTLLHKTPWHNLVYKISPPPGIDKRQQIMCLELYGLDKNRWGSQIDIIASGLLNCPCSAAQAWRDRGRYRQELSSRLCFVQIFPNITSINGIEGAFTQKCCYASWE